jgi:3-methyl-2-oxobutanoate hydroxymethyltransferase
MGVGAGCDAQYLFSTDILGYTHGHTPRQPSVPKVQTEYDRLQAERINAFKEFASEVETGAYPQEGHVLSVADIEFDAFVKSLPA